MGWLLSSVACAQETKEVTEETTVFLERYSVLKANKRTKHGSYQRYFSGKLIEEGDYTQGQRTGLWEFYDSRGTLDQRFDYTAQQVRYSVNYDQPDSLRTLYTVVIGSDTSFVRLAKPPVPIGGNSQLARIMMTNLRYPINAQRSGKQGAVLVVYTIDETGTFRPARVLRSSGDSDMDTEALRVINLYGALQWIPAELNGRKVGTTITQPVRFTNLLVGSEPR